MSDTTEVRGKRVLVKFESKRCIHARECVTQRPDAFVPNADDWIRPDAASPDEIATIAACCPSGAIQYERLDGGPNERPPGVNTAKVRENGPVALRGDLRLNGQPIGLRATLCRCGHSLNKPFCDGAHVAAGFVATGEPATEGPGELASRDGVVEIAPQKNGPLKVSGNLEVVSGTGRVVKRQAQTWLCRCGASSKKPYCDGTHNKIGFQAE